MTTVAVIVAALVLFASMAYVIVRLIEQRDESAKEAFDLRFELADAAIAAERSAAIRDAVVARLAEVLVEHAECPVPVVTS